MNLIAITTNLLIGISVALSSLISARSTNPIPSFDLLTFFWGGTVGAFVAALSILGIERVLDWIISSRKLKQEEEQITNAMKSELRRNIQICTDILEGYSANPGKIFSYHHHFSTPWLNLYKSKVVDFTQKTDRDKYEQLDWLCNQMAVIEEQRKNMQLFDAFTQATFQAPQQLAIHNYQGITNYSSSISVMTNELREKLKKFVEK